MIRSTVLLLVAIALGAILIPIGIVYTGFKKAFKLKYLAEIFFRIAYSIDQLGNTACKYFFNDLFIKDDTEHPFGNPDETISSVLGKNYLKNNLTFIGELLNNLLNFLDTNHSVKSIESFTNKTYPMKKQTETKKPMNSYFQYLTVGSGKPFLAWYLIMFTILIVCIVTRSTFENETVFLSVIGAIILVIALVGYVSSNKRNSEYANRNK